MLPQKLAIKILRYSGLPLLFREFVQRKQVSILLFHDLDPASARAVFAYLKSRYNLISLASYLEARRKKTCHLLPPKSLVITFDDGYARNRELLPIVQELDIPLTIFLCSGLLGTRRHYWFKFRQREIPGVSLKGLPNAERLAVLEKAGFRQDREFEEAQVLSRTQVMEMKEFADLQAHTKFHPFLSKCTDDEAWEEIHGAKEILERDFGLSISALAFPHGDYTDRDADMARKAGYQCALTVDYGFNTDRTDLYRLKRLSVDDSGDIDRLSLKASGVWGFFQQFSL